MESNLEIRMKKYEKQHKRRKILNKVVSVLSAAVVFVTTYALILPAITQERETFCEKAEHTHSESCYAVTSGDAAVQTVCSDGEHLHDILCFAPSDGFETAEISLVCEIPSDYGHSHNEECYTDNLICTSEENHLHSEECYSEETLICEKTESHIHSDECYESILSCEIPESEGHNHSEICYSVKTFSCIEEEHSHSLLCYSDENADIETESQWTFGFAEMIFGDDTAENILNIAKTQLGYHESTRNYIVLEDGETIKGRTRYGEWNGTPYENWNSLFAGFVLDYSKSDIPFDADIEIFTEKLKATEVDIYKSAGEHSPLPGDMVFISLENNGISDAVGFVYEVSETEIKIIAGDIDNRVQVISYTLGDTHIVGYGAIAEPSPYLCGKEEHLHEEKCFDEEGNVFCGYDEHAHSDICLAGYEEPAEPEYFCGFDEHAHSEECYDEARNLFCESEEHSHSDDCLVNSEETAEPEYFCGFDEHTHSEECYDEAGNLFCESEEHSHGDDCLVSFESLPEEERIRIENVISMIDPLPTADGIDAKIIEFEEAEDYEGEEAWLTEVYRSVQLAYRYYMNLPENQRKFVSNREKLMELEFIWSAAVLIETEIAETISYSADMFTSSALFVVYTESNGNYYAFDGTGSAVPINIDSNGIITADVADKYELLWSFTEQDTDTYLIKNASSGRYMHAYPNNGSGVTTAGAYSSVVSEVSGGVIIRSNTEYACLDEENGVFRMTQSSSDAAVYNFGIYDTSGELYIWLDGTLGGMNMYSGSDDTGYTVEKGSTFILPESWKSPTHYSYKVRGWYDIIGKTYYPARTEITVSESTVFYADWIPATYDIGQFNAHTSQTSSTSDFITTKVFDYNVLFNTPTIDCSATINSGGHTESWSMDGEGLIFRDWDGGKISYPSGGNNGINNYTGNSTNEGILTGTLIETLFGSSDVVGKTYLGYGDHLFQYCDDPANTEYYGYYYYDSLYHAASYNQSAQRFYVYDYLERATTSSNADFLPLNSPYVNTNGQPVTTYSYNGIYGEYSGTEHYHYDSGGVGAEYWFGIQTDIEFYLANKPGTTDSEGNNANQGINGKDLVFEFTGDDDVWVFVDGKLVLDIGGIHNALDGSINFSTGEVIVNGVSKESVTYLEPGQHTLTMYYLERGASQSNCRIKFNIGTRYGLKLQKEDVLTRELLNGAEFSVFTDEACSEPAQLWTSEISYKNGDPSTNVFTVSNGYTYMWGLSAGNTYYIKETKYPENGYGAANGIIVMKLNNMGTATFDVIADPNADDSGLSGGFTVHGYKIDVENHEVYLIATNGNYGDETTSVQAVKKWNDGVDHSGDSVTVYLLANGKRIREAVLNKDNDWKYVWDNLPLYNGDGTEVVYTVEEGTVPGYFGTITELVSSTVETVTWEEAFSLTNEETYIFKNSSGYLSAGSSGLYWTTDEATAKISGESRWTVTANGSTYIFKNEAGFYLYYSNSYFQSSSSNGTDLYFTNGRFRSGNRNYLGSLSGGRARRTTSSSSALVFTPYMETTTTETIVIEGKGFLITNTPVSEAETVSLKVSKYWDTGNLATEESYNQLVVKIKLLANGVDSGITGELSLKNGWVYSFTDLPKFDSGGNEIIYTVEEIPPNSDWTPEYGGIIQTDENSFETTVTNTYNLHYELPKTGGSGNIIHITGGIIVLSASSALIYKQCHKKRGKEDNTS